MIRKGEFSVEIANIFWRNIKWRLQNPLTVIMTLLQPLIWLLLYSTVFNADFTGISSGSYTGFILPGILVLVIFASSGSSGVINYIMNNINNRIVIISTHDEEDVKKLRANVLFVDNKAGSCYNNV